MHAMIERCAGIDVHQATVVITVRVPDGAGRRRSETQTFGTMASDLLAARAWLQAHGVTHVALESTGVYWRPLYYLLEEGDDGAAREHAASAAGARAQVGRPR